MRKGAQAAVKIRGCEEVEDAAAAFQAMIPLAQSYADFESGRALQQRAAAEVGRLHAHAVASATRAVGGAAPRAAPAAVSPEPATNTSVRAKRIPF
jgi:hypothetical protein